MIAKALEFITGLKEDALEPKVLNIDGKTYCTKHMERYDVKRYADTLRISTLTALVDYIKGCPEELNKKMIIQIVSPSSVILKSGLDEEKNREALLEVKADLPLFDDNRWMSQESFMIMLQAMFDDTPDKDALLKIAGNIQNKATADYGDDGVTQKTTIRQGVASLVDVKVPNPVMLRPYRTFMEIEQPVSEFIFRINGDGEEPDFKLVDANGKKWVIEAKQRIKEYLERELYDVGAGLNIIIMA